MITLFQNPKKYLLFFIVSLIVIVIAGLLSPIISESLLLNKDKDFEEKINLLQKETQRKVLNFELKLLAKLSTIKNISNSVNLSDPKEREKLFETFIGDEFAEVGVGVYDNLGNLILWNNNHPLSHTQYKNLHLTVNNEESFFYNNSLKSFLAILSKNAKYEIFLSIPLQKNYKLRNEYFVPLSLSDEISHQYYSDLEIIYEKNILEENVKYDKFSFDISNGSGNKIGYAHVNKINTDENIEKFEGLIILIQSSFTIIAFIFLGLWSFSFYIQKKYKPIHVLFISLYILLFRLMMFFLDIPSNLGIMELNNPIYFSSTFGFGIVKSPMELFLTVLALISILIITYQFIVSDEVRKREFRTNKLSIITIVIVLTIILFSSLRIFGSTISSVVFDSTILYFKEAILFSDLPTTFMYLNVLLTGTGFVLLSIIIVLIIFKVLDKVFKQNQIQLFLFSLILLQIFGFSFDVIQENPQTSWFIRVLFIFIIVVISYYITYTKMQKYSVLLTVLFTGSFLSISLLSYFNSELEKRSLKTTSMEMSRSSINLLDYYADEIIYNISEDKSIKQKLLKNNVDFNSEAFVIWSNSTLSKDAKSSIINIIASDKTLLGSFNYDFDEPYIWDWGDDKSDVHGIAKVYQNIDGTDNQVIRAITPIKLGEKLLGYIEVSLLYDVYGFAFEENEKVLVSSNLISKISVNKDLLKIFEFRNRELINYYTDILISDPEKEELLNYPFLSNNEEWASIKINEEDHTFYLSKHENNGFEELIAVGLRDKDVTWNLYDFFKVFFIHSIMIVMFLFLITLLNLPKKSELKISFKTKILISLLLVSILPLILLATYFKGITEEKNSAAVYYKLGKRADNVDKYLNNYFISSTLTEAAIFDKTVNDLGIHFSVYENEELLYSSEGTYYKIGLLPKIINAEVYLSLYHKGEKEFVIQESIEKYNFNSFYYKTFIGDKTYIINVSDSFNRIQLPMTGAELNIFLFGTYSLAIIFIILLSTLLANQISSPIEKLTKATKSVGSGDLDIQLKSYDKGEIKELIDGFNKMVRELKRNQIELAEVERESAWKEMAKQVAHEIKNPLTPMKLAVQHLISAYEDKSNKFDEIFNKVTSTVITQIENLTNIASEFSSFAKMPTIKLEEVELIGIIRETADLFIEENCEVKVSTEINEIRIKSDKEQFQRMMINIIRNSIQAEATIITVTVKAQHDSVDIKVKDDGYGISKEILSKIFDENYTTKKEGMGLGLSLARRFLDVTGGRISVNETTSEGTEILIKIPNN